MLMDVFQKRRKRNPIGAASHQSTTAPATQAARLLSETTQFQSQRPRGGGSSRREQRQLPSGFAFDVFPISFLPKESRWTSFVTSNRQPGTGSHKSHSEPSRRTGRSASLLLDGRALTLADFQREKPVHVTDWTSKEFIQYRTATSRPFSQAIGETMDRRYEADLRS
jgi:hypothetical protein